MTKGRRPKDGMFTKFYWEAIPKIITLVPNFATEDEANRFYQKFISYKRFRDLEAEHLLRNLPPSVDFPGNSRRCTWLASFGLLELAPDRQNPLELLHLLAHYLQPPESKWHGGEFGSLYLNLIDRAYGPDMKRAVKDILIAHNIRTSVRSPETRQRQSEAYHRRKVQKAPEGLKKILADMEALRDPD